MTAKNATIGLAAASLLAFASAQAQEKVSLGEPRDDKVQLEEPKSVPVDKEIRDLPDGVLKVKTNPDGTFKSLIVKATVEIEDILGAQKGKRQARKDAEVLCKRHLSQWLKDNCAFAEAQTRVTTIITKGESSKDAAGNRVIIRNQKAEEIKANTEGYVSASTAVLKGLIVLESEVTGEKEYVLVMGLSQKTMDQAKMVAAALSSNRPGLGEGPAGAKPSTDKDTPNPERKTNPELEDFLK